jgi:hypothetical protein
MFNYNRAEEDPGKYSFFSLSPYPLPLQDLITALLKDQET